MSLISANKLIDLNRLSQYNDRLKEYMLQEIANKINAKTQTYVVTDATNIVLRTGVNLPSKPTTDYSNVASFTTINGTPVTANNVKVGDVILIVDTEVPDYWISNVNTVDNIFSISKLETQKVNLDVYATNAQLQVVSNNLEQLQGLHGELDTFVREDLRPTLTAVDTLAAQNKATIDGHTTSITDLQGRCSTLENITIATGDEILALFN